MTATIDATGARLDLKFRQGNDFVLAVTLLDGDRNPYDATGATFAAALRDKNSDAVVATIEVLAVDLATGRIQLRLGRAVTTTLPPKTYSWELAVTDTADIKRDYLSGLAEVSRR